MSGAGLARELPADGQCTIPRGHVGGLGQLPRRAGGPVVEERLDTSDIYSSDEIDRLGVMITRAWWSDMEPSAAQEAQKSHGVPGRNLNVVPTTKRRDAQLSLLGH
jgi:hypothetical protein